MFIAYTSATVVNSLTSYASLQCDDITEEKDQVTGKLKGEQHPDLAKGRALGGFRSRGQLGRALGPLLGMWIQFYIIFHDIFHDHLHLCIPVPTLGLRPSVSVSVYPARRYPTFLPQYVTDDALSPYLRISVSPHSLSFHPLIFGTLLSATNS